MLRILLDRKCGGLNYLKIVQYFVLNFVDTYYLVVLAG